MTNLAGPFAPALQASMLGACAQPGGAIVAGRAQGPLVAVALVLTVVEVPGSYIAADAGRLWVSDQIAAGSVRCAASNSECA